MRIKAGVLEIMRDLVLEPVAFGALRFAHVVNRSLSKSVVSQRSEPGLDRNRTQLVVVLHRDETAAPSRGRDWLRPKYYRPLVDAANAGDFPGAAEQPDD